MNKEQKQEVIETLKSKFSQYSNFYITDTQNLSVAQITNLRRHCFDKQVEMKVAKNTLIKKALESLDNDKYSGVYDSLHQVTALMFSDSPKEPALIISSFRKALNGEKPLLKAAFLNGDIFVGDNQLVNLTKIKTKNELIGEVIGLLMSPIQRVIGALQNRPEAGAEAKAPAGGTEVNSGSKADTTAVNAPAPAEAKVETKPEETAPKSTASDPGPESGAAIAPASETGNAGNTGTKAAIKEPPSQNKPEVQAETPVAAEAAPADLTSTAEASPVSEVKTGTPAADEAKPETKTSDDQPEA